MQPEPRVALDHPDLLGGESEMAQAARDRGVSLVRQVGHPVALRVAGRGQPSEIGHRAAAAQHTLGAGRQAEQFAQPLEHDELHRGRARAARPRGYERVEPGSQPVSEHAGERRRTGYSGEEARVIVVLSVNERRVDEPAHGLDRVAWLLRNRSAEFGHQGLRCPGLDRRRLAAVLEVVDHRIDDPVAEAAHLLGAQAECVGPVEGGRR